jgi:outer membrane protein
MSEKKTWLIVGVVVAALIGGIGGFFVGKLTSKPMQVGYVDVEKLMQDFPAYKDATSILRGEQVELEQQFQEQSKNLSDEEKQKLGLKLQEQLAKKDKELSDRVESEIRGSVQKVAEEKKLTIVSAKNVLFYGGQDITDSVLAKGGALVGKDEKAPSKKK